MIIVCQISVTIPTNSLRVIWSRKQFAFGVIELSRLLVKQTLLSSCSRQFVQRTVYNKESINREQTIQDQSVEQWVSRIVINCSGDITLVNKTPRLLDFSLLKVDHSCNLSLRSNKNSLLSLLPIDLSWLGCW